MSFPFYFRLGPYAVHAHWIFETLAYSTGFYLYRRLRRRDGDVIDPRARVAVTAAVVVGGFLGSRLLAAFEDPFTLPDHWTDAAFLLSGKTIAGGLIGGLLMVEGIKRLLGVRIATGDVLALPLIVGIAIGRIGCFLSGLEDQSYGVATALPWGVDFGDGVARHPTQIYEIVFLGALAALLLFRTGHLTALGDRFKLFLASYLAFRVAIEFIKPVVRVGGLSAIQWASLAVIAYYLPHLPRIAMAARRG